MSDDVTTAKISDLLPDQQNANQGTERGLFMLDKSLRQYGAGRSILVDKHGRIIAGNKTAERAADIGIDDVIVVRTDGRKLVAVQRTDLDLEQDVAARELAYADNRVGQVDLEWDAAQLLADLEAGVNLDQFWRADEIDLLQQEAAMQQALVDDLTGRTLSPERKLGDAAKHIKPVLYSDEVTTFEAAIKKTGVKNRGEALMTICRAYLDAKG